MTRKFILRLSLSRQLCGSTLIEVLVAMTLVSIIFVIGTMTWLQLNNRVAPDKLVRERLRARRILVESQESEEVSDRVFSFDGIKFTRKVKLLNSETDLYEIQVICQTSDDEIVLERSKIIRLHED